MGFCPQNNTAPSFLTSLFVSSLVLVGLFVGIYVLFVRTIMLSSKKSHAPQRESQGSYLSL